MKFYWYHDQAIKSYLKAKFKNPAATEHMLGNSAYQKLHKINLCFSDNPWGMLHDITNHVDHPFAITTKNQYHYQLQTKTFGDICIDTAEKIATQSDRLFAVFWSGGIDSTSVLVAMMQTVPLDRLVVVCNRASIEEFPSFYEQKIKYRVNTITPGEFIKCHNNYYSVTGDGGDTVWGVIDDSFWQAHQHQMRKPWKDTINRKIFDDFEFLEEFCSWSGVEINTWLDLRVWFYLCCKWQDKCMRPYSFRNNLTAADITAFYDVDNSFQTWTMNNFDNIIGSTWQDYKIPAKQFIYQYHPDIDYLKHKSKVNSVSIIDEFSLYYDSYTRFTINTEYAPVSLPSWPFVDYSEIENFNDQYQLIPRQLLTE